MYHGQKVVVVVPAYNEEAYIEDTLNSIPRDIVDKIIVVDDGSSDFTPEKVKGSNVYLVRHPQNLGVGAAIKTGFFNAISQGGDVAIVMAGDGQMDPRDLPNLLEKISEGYDYVVGDRFEKYNPIEFGMPIVRAKASFILSLLTLLVTGIFLRDPQCGYVAITSKAIKQINWKFITNGWGIHNDTLMMCSVYGFKVSTASVRPVYFDNKGNMIKSHIKLHSIIPRHLVMFFKLFIFRVFCIFGYNPNNIMKNLEDKN